HLGHLRAEQLLDRLLDLNLVGVARHLEHHRAPILAQRGGLLGHERPPEHFGQFHDSTSCSFSSAACVSSTLRVSITSRAVTRLLGSSRTPGRLRTDSANFSSGCTSTISVLPVAPSVRSIAAAVRVFTSSTLSASTTT